MHRMSSLHVESADQHHNFGGGSGSGGGGSSSSYYGGGDFGASDGSDAKVKRAKSIQKITRHRKITSCLQCRERKQKCDRLRPVCSNCMAGNSRGGMCTYVDTRKGVQEVLANEEEKDSKRVKLSPSSSSEEQQMHHHHRQAQRSSPPSTSTAQQSHGPSAGLRTPTFHGTSFSHNARPMLPARSPLTQDRIELITRTIARSRDRSLNFEDRVRFARAAAVGLVLFGEPPINALYPDAPPPLPQAYHPLAAVDSLKLPTAAEIGPFLDTYREKVEWMCNVVLVDLNRARFEAFLNWWHSNPQTLPADPPLIPLVLTVLALAIQARRMAPHCTLNQRDASSTAAYDTRDVSPPPSGGRGRSPRDPYLNSCSAEKELLETAQRCMDTMQILCPSNWASAFSAPLDLVRASLLRGLWHMTELHLQFAGSCLAATIRLANAASLNHDTRHWPSMGKEEAQARRNIFWSVATIETTYSARVIQPSMILPNSYDTNFPDDFAALINLYRYGGLIEPYIVEGRRSRHRVKPVTRNSFDFYMARFQLTDILIKGQDMLRTGDKTPMAEAHEQWLRGLPSHFQNVLRTSGAIGRHADADAAAAVTSADGDGFDRETRYLQISLLQMMNYATIIHIHRPQADETGQWRAPDGQAQRSLEICIDSAQRLIWLVHAMITRDPGPPFVLFHQCVFYCFQAAIVIAIQSALSVTSLESSSSSGDAGVAAESANFAAQARPSLDKALQTLDLVAQQHGLRYLAEQACRYAATLREIGAAQQRGGRGGALQGQPSSNSQRGKVIGPLRAATTMSTRMLENKGAISATLSRNVRRAGLGVQPLAVVEGDGKLLGGQGYPSGTGPQHNDLQSTATPAAAIAAAGLPSRLNMLATEHQTSGMATQRNGHAKIPFNRAPQQSLPELLASPGNIPSMMPIMPHSSFGIDFNDLHVFGGPSDVHTRFDILGEDSFVDRPLSRTALSNSVAPAATSTTPAHGLELWTDSALPEEEQPIVAPALESFGASFANDWSELEHEVARLLYTER